MKYSQHHETYHHIVLKAHTTTQLFRHNSDFETFLDILRTKKKQFAFELLGYCLLKDHVHLILDTSTKSSLSSVIHGLSLLYTKYYQKKYSTTGPIFSGRGLSETFHNSKELICRLRYIHQKGKLKGSDRTLNYLYSSYIAYAHPEESSMIDRHRVYLLFDRHDPQKASNLFCSIHHAVDETPVLDISENLYEKVSLAKQILREELRHYHLDYHAISRPSALREKIIVKLYQETGLNQQEVADILCISRHIVGRAIRLSRPN